MINHEEKLFFVGFDDESHKVVGIEFFSDENGYGEDEAERISRLGIAELIYVYSGYQSVIRVR